MPGIKVYKSNNWQPNNEVTAVRKYTSSGWQNITAIYYWDNGWIKMYPVTYTLNYTYNGNNLKAENSNYQGGQWNNNDLRTGTWSGGVYQGFAFGVLPRQGTVTTVKSVKINLTKGSSGGTGGFYINMYLSNYYNSSNPNSAPSTAPSSPGQYLVGNASSVGPMPTSGGFSQTFTNGADSNQTNMCNIFKSVLNSQGSNTISIYNGNNGSVYSNYTAFSVTIVYDYQ